MTAFNSTTPLYLVLCCINATLLVLILLPTNRQPATRTGDSSHPAMINMHSFKLARKMAMAVATPMVNNGLPEHHQFHLEQALHRGNHMAAPRQLRLSQFIMGARRSLLHLAAEAQQEPSITKVAINTNSLGVKKSADVPYDHLPHHDMDVSATFHVDYSGPKTHPPKNN